MGRGEREAVPDDDAETSGTEAADARSRAPLALSARAPSENGSEGPLLTTGDMARLGRSTLRTVRFYEEAGLLKVARHEGGHRLFSETELHKLRLASDLREAGLSLSDIKTLFELKARCGSAEEASARHAPWPRPERIPAFQPDPARPAASAGGASSSRPARGPPRAVRARPNPNFLQRRHDRSTERPDLYGRGRGH